MPSSPGYKRNYLQERKTATARGETADNATRKQARRDLGLKPFDGKDADHKKMLSEGGGSGKGNLRAVPTGKNRSRNGHKKGE